MFRFWNHMQILLPFEPPNWDEFLDEMKAKNSPKKDVWKPSHAQITNGKHTVYAGGDNGLKNGGPGAAKPKGGNKGDLMKWLVPIGIAALAAGIMIWRMK
eukprot:XP_011681944.1 PREDICTED: cytidine monophosphate-N-acetylneuraminic acid hydroxylase-like [Strongylocentrotus purpuratus]